MPAVEPSRSGTSSEFAQAMSTGGGSESSATRLSKVRSIDVPSYWNSKPLASVIAATPPRMMSSHSSGAPAGFTT